MTHPIVTTVSKLVFEGSIDSAERALATMADQEGDFALARVIEDMPPRDVVAILREHDSSHSSVISELISPRQFLAAVKLEAGYRERGHDSLKGMINAVVFADESRTDEFIETLGSEESGVQSLVDYFSDRHEEVEYFFRNGTYSELEGDDFSGIPASNDDLNTGELGLHGQRDVIPLREALDHDWKELCWRLRCEHFEIFREVIEILRLRHRQALAEAAAPAPKAAPTLPLEDDDDGDDVL